MIKVFIDLYYIFMASSLVFPVRTYKYKWVLGVRYGAAWGGWHCNEVCHSSLVIVIWLSPSDTPILWVNYAGITYRRETHSLSKQLWQTDKWMCWVMLESSQLLPLHTGPSSVCENAESRITDDISSPLSWPSHTRSIYHIITDDDLSSQDSTLP